MDKGVPILLLFSCKCGHYPFLFGVCVCRGGGGGGGGGGETVGGQFGIIYVNCFRYVYVRCLGYVYVRCLGHVCVFCYVYVRTFTVFIRLVC